MNSKLKKFIASGLAVALVLGCGAYAISKRDDGSKAKAASARQVESLDRGLVALKTSSGVFLSWRLLGTESSSTTFNVYRNGSKIASVSDSTNYLDTSGSTSNSYTVKSVVSGTEKTVSSSVTPKSDNYFDIPISVPSGGTTPDGTAYTYSANDASVGDLDGDGEYEIILKWDPSNSQDNSKDGYTGNVIIDAYKLSGTRLWRIDLGVNIRAGAHYTQFMVYDFDGDGCAEMVCKTADGTKDGVGNYIGTKSADYRTSAGRILSGPEYLTLFDGKTGQALDTIDYEPARGTVSSWGDSYGNRVDRFLAGVGYFNGKTPSVIMCRGYYTRAVVVTYDITSSKKFSKRWTYDSGSSTSTTSSAYGQGNHNLAVADIDYDGYDEIVYGSATLNNDGSLMYSTGLGHGDALHVGDFIPDNGIMEVYQCHEETYGASLRNGRTGSIIYRQSGTSDTGRCIAGNIVAGNSMAEFYSTAGTTVYNSSGTKVCDWSDITKWSPNFVVYWDEDLEQEVLDRTMVDDYPNGRILTASGVNYNNGSKANPSLCADILGDWREEIIWPTTDNTALRVYVSTSKTTYKMATLMHDTQYRCQVAAQNVSYNQPAHTSFYLGTGYSLPSQPNVYTVGSYALTSADSSSSSTTTTTAAATATATPTSSSSTSTASVVHNFTTDGKTSSFFSITGNLSTAKGTVSYNGLSLTQCLKLESSTSITFTTTASSTLTLVLNAANSTNVKVDGTKYTCDSNGIVTVSLGSGSHTITKANTGNLYYMSIVY